MMISRADPTPEADVTVIEHPYGASAQLFRCESPEVLIVGAGTLGIEYRQRARFISRRSSCMTNLPNLNPPLLDSTAPDARRSPVLRSWVLGVKRTSPVKQATGRASSALQAPWQLPVFVLVRRAVLICFWVRSWVTTTHG